MFGPDAFPPSVKTTWQAKWRHGGRQRRRQSWRHKLGNKVGDQVARHTGRHSGRRTGRQRASTAGDKVKSGWQKGKAGNKVRNKVANKDETKGETKWNTTWETKWETRCETKSETQCERDREGGKHIGRQRQNTKGDNVENKWATGGRQGGRQSSRQIERQSGRQLGNKLGDKYKDITPLLARDWNPTALCCWEKVARWERRFQVEHTAGGKVEDGAKVGDKGGEKFQGSRWETNWETRGRNKVGDEVPRLQRIVGDKVVDKVWNNWETIIGRNKVWDKVPKFQVGDSVGNKQTQWKTQRQCVTTGRQLINLMNAKETRWETDKVGDKWETSGRQAGDKWQTRWQIKRKTRFQGYGKVGEAGRQWQTRLNTCQRLNPNGCCWELVQRVLCLLHVGLTAINSSVRHSSPKRHHPFDFQCRQTTADFACCTVWIHPMKAGTQKQMRPSGINVQKYLPYSATTPSLLNCLIVCLVASLREAPDPNPRCPRDLAKKSNKRQASRHSFTLVHHIMSLIAHDRASIWHFVKVERPTRFFLPQELLFQSHASHEHRSCWWLASVVQRSFPWPMKKQCSRGMVWWHQTMPLLWEQIAKVPLHINSCVAWFCETTLFSAPKNLIVQGHVIIVLLQDEVIWA